MSAVKDNLDLGRLLRVQAMVAEAVQTEATYSAGIALVRAYLSLREEIMLIVQGLEPLRQECVRLFPPIDYPTPFSPALQVETQAKLEAAASEALLGLRKLGGWIQGLINEMTFEQRLRMEAEEKAKLASRPATGFASRG